MAIVGGGCLVAGLCGVIRDQLTFTISPEYTKFKFLSVRIGERREQGINAQL